MKIVEKTVDDILQRVFQNLLKSKKQYTASRGIFTEVIGAQLVLSNPLARLCKAERRETLISCLAELLWYATGSNELKMIEHYIPRYRENLDDPNASWTPGAYGPRLFGSSFSLSQIRRAVEQLKRRDTTRQAVIQVFANGDLQNPDPPCTCCLQFFLRSSKLHLVAYMRSNDAFVGLPHDIFAFTMIQEIVARSLGVGLGEYHHLVGSLHLYDKNKTKAREYVDEGWQRISEMPSMPIGMPWESLSWLLEIESQLRNNPWVDFEGSAVDPYWRDLARILQIHGLLKSDATPGGPTLRKIVQIKNAMATREYDVYIRRKAPASLGVKPGPLFGELQDSTEDD